MRREKKKSMYIYICIYLQENVYKSHMSSRVFLTHSLTFFLNAVRSSRHIIDASILAAESQFGSLNIERTERRIVSRRKPKIIKKNKINFEYSPTVCTGDQRSDARS